MNLVSDNSLADVWRRHFLDSAQVYDLVRGLAGPLVDLGSGAGFPGLVLSIMGVPDVHLIESDQKKAAFLVDTVRKCGATAKVHACRIEAFSAVRPAAITARALAPMPKLMKLAYPLFSKGTRGIFLKGQNVVAELTEAHKMWKMDYDLVPSRSDPSGTLVVVREVSRVKSD